MKTSDVLIFILLDSESSYDGLGQSQGATEQKQDNAFYNETDLPFLRPGLPTLSSSTYISHP